MEKTNEALVAEYLGGNEDAFALILKRHLRSVYSFAARSVPDEADDIAQDTFLKVWKNLRAFDPQKAQFKTWLMRIARNTVTDYLRKKKSLVFSDFENGDASPFDMPDPEPLPDELIARASDARSVREVLEKLPPAYREVLLLRYMSRLTFQEISETLGEPSNTIRSRHHRGLLQLRKLLEDLHQRPA